MAWCFERRRKVSISYLNSLEHQTTPFYSTVHMYSATLSFLDVHVDPILAILYKRKFNFVSGSLKSSSSRRRPVSVDYDLNSNSFENELDDPVAIDNDDFQMGGASMGGGRVLKDTTNSRSSHYSNRNSHPLTEREMEQGLQSIEGQKGTVRYGNNLNMCVIIIITAVIKSGRVVQCRSKS